jgi:hypothetical protein
MLHNQQQGRTGKKRGRPQRPVEIPGAEKVERHDRKQRKDKRKRMIDPFFPGAFAEKAHNGREKISLKKRMGVRPLIRHVYSLKNIGHVVGNTD